MNGELKKKKKKKRAAWLLQEHGNRAHYFLGKGFDGDAIKPVVEEGILVMAKEYQKSESG